MQLFTTEVILVSVNKSLEGACFLPSYHNWAITKMGKLQIQVPASVLIGTQKEASAHQYSQSAGTIYTFLYLACGQSCKTRAKNC